MVFKNISNIIERKKRFIGVSENKNSQIKDNLYSFLKDKFGGDLEGISINISYNSKDNSLTLACSNKIIANEITLQLVNLVKFLKDKNINLSRILVK